MAESERCPTEGAKQRAGGALVMAEPLWLQAIPRLFGSQEVSRETLLSIPAHSRLMLLAAVC